MKRKFEIDKSRFFVEIYDVRQGIISQRVGRFEKIFEILCHYYSPSWATGNGSLQNNYARFFSNSPIYSTNRFTPSIGMAL